MGKAVQLNHKRPDGIRVESFKIPGPAIFISQSPKNDGGMIEMLVNHRFKHGAALLLVTIAAKSPTTPWNLLPNKQAQFIAQLQDLRRLLVMTEPDEIRAHVLDLLKCLTNNLIRHGCADPGVVLVILGAAQQ